MNVLVQLSIGVLAAGLIMGALCCVKKMRRLSRYIYTGLVTAAGIALLVCGLMAKKPVTEVVASPLTKEEQVEFAYAFAQQGDYETAEELMTEYSNVYGYDDACSLFTARMELLQGNYAVAGGIYARLQTNEEYKEQIEEEYALVQAKGNVDLSAMATVRYLKQQGLNPADYGFSETEIQGMEETMQVTDEVIAAAVKNIISEEYKTKGFEKTVNAVTEADKLYDMFLDGYYGTPDEEMTAQIKGVRKTLEKKLGDGEGQCACVRNALLKMNLLLRDYDKIAENIDESSTYVELMAVSELYMNRLVREKDFKGTYIGELVEETDAYSDVVGQKVKEIYKDKKKSLDDEEEAELEMLVDYWKIEAKHPVLTGVRTLLEAQAKESVAGSDVSKVYLQLAKIAHYYENEKNRSGHLANAIGSGAGSEDAEYSQAMQKISAIINGDGDINEVMNISDYVRRALQNAMPYEMDEFLTGNGNIDLYDNEQEPVSLEESFTKVFEEYVNKTRSAVNISAVDTEAFETVKLRLSVSSDYAVTAEQLRKMLTLTDCGFEITDFTVEKLEYTEGRTHLACDVSGSMDNCVHDLRNAVIAYIAGRNPKENLAISSFASSIKQTLPFGSSNEELTEFANSFYASGGTSIYWTIMNILENFDSTAYSNNSLILMTDGEDGDYVTDAMIANDLAARAKEKNVKVYTIGLGSVNAGYLTKIAEAGGGVFVHTKESAGLDALYSFLQGQVGNQYIITFKAKDTLTAKNRVVEAIINNGEAKCDFTYSLDLSEVGGSEEQKPNTGSAGTGTVEPETNVEEALPVSTLYLSGVSVREIYKSHIGCDNTVLTSVAAFTDTMNGSVRIYNDEYSYVVPLVYKNKFNAEFTVPWNVPVGTYDIEVKVDGKTGLLKNAFVIRERKQPQTIKFGAYVFRADNVYKQTDTRIVLSGNVVMNGWLQFVGSLTIEGDLENDTSVTITDLSGSKVVFDAKNAKGYAADMAKKGNALYVKRLGSFEIYNDLLHLNNLDEYRTDNIVQQEFQFAEVCCISEVGLQLYPDRFELTFESVETRIPFVSDLFKKPKNESKELYDSSFDDVGITITDEVVGFKLSYEKEHNEEVAFLNKAVNIEKFNLNINTVDDEYSAGILFKFFDFPNTGASITISDVMGDKVKIKDFSITMPVEFTKTLGMVPVTFSGFTFGVEGDNLVEQFKNKNFAKMTFVGKMNLSTAKISKVVPKLSKFIKDEKEILSMPETTLKFTASPFQISGDATLYFMKEVQLAQAKVKIGEFTFDNALIDLNSVTTKGLSVALALGLKWNEDALSVDVGAGAEIDAHSAFFGVQIVDAHIDMALKWWGPDIEFDCRADALLGFSKSKKGKGQFNAACSYVDGKKQVKKWYYINEDEGWEKRTEKTKIKK